MDPKLINLRKLFSVKDVLKARGFDVTQVGDGTNLFLPVKRGIDSALLFNCFDNTKVRKDILQRIKNPSFDSRYKLIDELFRRNEFVATREAFSATFEWYIGELLVRKFSAFSSAYGVEVANIQRNTTGKASGDFDVLAVLRNVSLAYVECKTGNFNREAVLRCVERAVSLHCEFSIIMVDKIISERKLLGILGDIEHPLTGSNWLNRLVVKGHPTSRVYDWMNCYFLSSTANVEEQLRAVLRVNEAKKAYSQYILGLSEESFSRYGYECQTLLNNIAPLSNGNASASL